MKSADWEIVPCSKNQRQPDLSLLTVVLFCVEVKPEWPESISSDKNTHFSHQL